MSKIEKVIAREILDSRGNPTVEVDVVTEGNILGRSAIPSGASTGSREALELRDGDSKRFNGKGVLKAVKNVNSIIASKITGMDAGRQNELDTTLIKLDGTANKSKLGANAIRGVSIASAKASANAKGVELFDYIANLAGCKGTTLPTPFMNIINGGAHADNNLDFQEFMIVPGGFTTFREALRAAAETYHALKSILKSKNYSTAVGDEGGFAPNLYSNEEALDLILEAIEKAGYVKGKDIAVALDVAASEFYEGGSASNGKYVFRKSDNLVRTSLDMIALYEKLISQYPIISIEDGLAEGDWSGWTQMTRVLGGKVQIVGDDIFVTNPEILKKGIKEGVANSILIKLNQIGTITETLSAIKIAKESGHSAIISHRSGETEDTIIADLAVATDVGMLKTGAPCRTDRVAKYNRLLRIEEILGKKGSFVGFGAIKKGE